MHVLLDDNFVLFFEFAYVLLYKVFSRNTFFIFCNSKYNDTSFIVVFLGISEFGEEKSVPLDGLTEQQIDGKLKELVLQ